MLEEKIATMERMHEAQFKINEKLKVNIEVLKCLKNKEGPRK